MEASVTLRLEVRLAPKPRQYVSSSDFVEKLEE
jgi:hypothetical protein